MKNIIIDCRMREAEREFFKTQGYKLIEIEKSKKVYPEISSHVDIFCTKIDNNLVIEPSNYDRISKKIKSSNLNIVKRKR